MSPPPVPDRNGLPPEPPSSGDQPPKVSAISEFIFPAKSPIGIPPPSFAFSSSPVVAPSGASYAFPGAPSPSLAFPSAAPPSISTVPASFSPDTALPLFTDPVHVSFQIMTILGNVGSFGTPICNPLPQTIPMVQKSGQSAFISGPNFRSKDSPIDASCAIVSSPIASSIPSPFFNSSLGYDRPGMGRILPRSISEKSPVAGNAQMLDFAQFPATASVDLAPPPAGSVLSGPGSTTTVPSPFHGGAPTGKSTAHPRKSTQWAPSLKSANPGISTGFSVPTVEAPLPISFRDALAPSSPRTAKNSFKDVLESMDEMPAPSFLDGKSGLRFPDEIPLFVHAKIT